MAVSEYHLDTRIRRRHVSLITQQRRLRHLRSISARNMTLNDTSEVSLFFTLHRKPELKEFYTSEALESSNPSWKDFETNNFPENIDTACSFICVKVWNGSKDRQLLLEWVVFFSGLMFLGEQIPKEGKNFKPNSLIFGMIEGYYGCSDCYQHVVNNSSDIHKETLSTDITGLRKSYTLSTLSRIKTVERAIKQTQANVQRRQNNINSRLQSSQELHKVHAQRELLKIKISVLRAELQFQQQNVNSLEREIASSKKDILRKRKEIDEKKEQQVKLVERHLELNRNYREYRESLLKTEAQLSVRRKELISELCCIYPIIEFPDKKGFSIRDVHLPNSEKFAGHDETMIAIALGYVCHLILMISQFLNVPLRYSIHFYGSRSTIIDHISSSIPDKTREFPLHSKGKDRRCFEYGVFLLNKNIAQLRIYSGLTTRDLSATLPNLNNLIELRLSMNNEPHGIYIAAKPQSSETQLGITVESTQNGFSNSAEIMAPPTPGQLKPSDSELEILRREMHAMMPNSSTSSRNSLKPLHMNKESAATLSCSLDKGLNDIKMFEKSIEGMKIEVKPPPVSPHVYNLKQSFHHSSYPNLTAEAFAVESQLPSIPPKVWTADSSRTNSEEEQVDDRPNLVKQKTVVNDSIFYIPSHTPDKVVDKAKADEFTADLSLRTEQLANQRSNFQMQRLQSSASDEAHC